MASEPIRVQDRIRFGEDFELEVRSRRLRRNGHTLKLERIPLEIMLLLLDHSGEIVTREQIVDKVWGKGTFLDTDNSIRVAIRKIRQALKDDPEYPRFIQTVTGQGYRFIAPVTNPPDEPSVVQTLDEEEVKEGDAETPLHAEGNNGPRNLRAGHWLALGLTAGLALIVASYVMFWSHPTQAKGPKITSLAVLPLKNLSGDPAQEYFADGMTEAVIGRLSMIRGLRVISRTSVMRFKDDQASVPEIGKTLGVDAIVEGSVIREGGRVRVHAQLIRAATDEHFWSEEYDRQVEDVLALESDVAQSIADKVAVTVTGQERSRLVTARQVLPEAYESYLKGMYDPQNSKAEIEHRIVDFEDCIRKDPAFAPAYVGLAETYLRLQDIFVGAPPSEIRPKAITALRKALELDPELAVAHAYLAEMYQKQWKWAESDAEFKLALELGPNDAVAHRGYADWLACQGRTVEALAWARRGRELDPLGNADSVGWHLLLGRRYDEAIREYRSVLAVHPDSTVARWGLGFALIANNQPQAAIPVLETAASMMKRSPGSLGMLAVAHARADNRTEALRLINELKHRRQKGYVPAGAFIDSHLAIGDYDQAFFWCDDAYREQSAILQWIKVSPLFDPVRGDPRFTDLLHRVGLDKSY